MGEVAPPPGTERDLGDRRRRHGRGSWCRATSRWRSAWPAWSRASGRAARRRPATCAALDLDEMLSRRRDERVGAGLRPVGRVGRRQLGLRAHDLAPDAAQQAEAIAADAFQRGLMAIGRADPGARRGDDAVRMAGSPSSEEAPAVEPRLALLRHADDEVVAGHVREAAEVDGVARTSPGRWRGVLSQPAVTRNVSPTSIGLRRALPQVELVRCRRRRGAPSPRRRCRHWRRWSR